MSGICLDEKVQESIKNCPEKALEHFQQANRHNIDKEYMPALREYHNALQSGFPDSYEAQQAMIDVGINMGMLMERAPDGTTQRNPSIKPTKEQVKEMMEALFILKLDCKDVEGAN